MAKGGNKGKSVETKTSTAPATNPDAKTYTIEQAPAATTALATQADLARFSSLIQLEQPGTEIAGFKRIGIPDVIPIKLLPVGAIIQAKVVDVVPSPNEDFKTDLMHLQHSSGAEFCFPIGTVIAGKIKMIGGKDQLIGREIMLKKTGERPSKRFSEKNYNVFDFFIRESEDVKPAKVVGK